jgi:hypothetical protein
MTALCAGQATTDDDPWFSDDPADQEYAKRVCALCVRRLSCLDGALAREEPHGVWGGLTSAERAALLMFTDDLLQPTDTGHGSRGRYVAGCHCGECTAANTAWMAEYRATDRPAPVTARETVDQQIQLTFEGISA